LSAAIASGITIQLDANINLTSRVEFVSVVGVVVDGQGLYAVDGQGSISKTSFTVIKSGVIGFYISGGSVTLKDLTITNANDGTYGGVYALGGASVYLENVMITKCYANALWVSGSSTTVWVVGSNIWSNYAKTYGAVVVSAGTLYLKAGTTISSNYAVDGYTGGGFGLGLTVMSGGSAYISASSIIDNGDTSRGVNYGGGVYVATASALYVVNSNITRNYAYNGGGVYSTGSSAIVSLVNSFVEANYATQCSGAVWANAGTTTVSSSLIAANQAVVRGPGFFADSSAVLTLSFCELRGNLLTVSTTAAYNAGVLAACPGCSSMAATITIIGCSFINHYFDVYVSISTIYITSGCALNTFYYSTSASSSTAPLAWPKACLTARLWTSARV